MITGVYRRYQELGIGWQILGFLVSLIYISWFMFSLFWLTTDMLNLGIFQTLDWSVPGISEDFIAVGLILGWIGIFPLLTMLTTVRFKRHDN